MLAAGEYNFKANFHKNNAFGFPKAYIFIFGN
jgi:hypothetical protein